MVVAPCGNVFYAQTVGELEVKEEYNALLDFEKFESIFPEVKEEDISHFRTRALEIMGKSALGSNQNAISKLIGWVKFYRVR